MKNMIALSLCVLTVVLTFAGCDLSTIVNNFTTPPAETDKPGTMTENTEKPMETQVQEPLIAEGTCGSDITWKLSEGGDLTLTGKRNMSDAASESQVPWHAHRKDIRTVQIEPGITGICDYAFFGCSALTQITIPESVKAIGDRAFEGCTGLTKITISNVKCTIGDSETTLGVPGTTTICGVWGSPVQLYAMEYGYPFELCDVEEGSNTAIAYGAFGNILWKLSKNGALNLLGKGNMPSTASASEVPWLSHSKDICTVQIDSGITSICDYAFSGCSALTSIGPTGNIQSIGVGAFAGCVSLKNIIIPSKVTVIRNNTFSGCTGLVQITITDKVTTIGAEAFSGCASLTQVTIPQGITSLEGRAFSGCTGLKNIFILNPECTIATSADTLGVPGTTLICGQTGSAAQAYAAKNGYQFEFGGVFTDTINQSVTWHLSESGVLTLSGTGWMPDFFSGEAPWYPHRQNIRTVQIKPGFYHLGSYAFKDCTALTQIDIPDTIKRLGSGVFQNCSSLTQISLPDKLTQLGPRAFQGCSSLTQITIPEGTTIIERDTFYRCSKLTEIIIPKGVKSIGEYAFYECTALTKVHIAGGVTSIGEHAFSMCENLVQVTLPDCLTTLGESAFCWCFNLKEINIPTSLTAIEKHTFMGCHSLTQITLPNGITMIGKGAFDDCYQLKQISIPERVTSIGERAFCGCNSLTQVTLPKSITSIAYMAFAWCDNLKDITIMNQDCAIDDHTGVLGFTDLATVHGYRGSTAQTYAQKYGYKFAAID